MKFLGALVLAVGLGIVGSVRAVDRPNLLWLTCEDTGPQLGCYGDAYAKTPNLDRLAARGLRYRRVWSVAPVCAPARTAIISGLYPSATGSEHMRSLVPMPRGAKMFPQYLREAGYYCSNNSKEDYNLVKPGRVWDESSPRAHWRNRSAGQPFFSVFNYTESHESQIRRPEPRFDHDPARAPVPPYMPDTPEVRSGWAQYHDRVSEVDGRVGRALRELEEAGLGEDTIVFFFGDHGSGMPRSKRSACDSGLRVPLLVYYPPRWRWLAPPEYGEGEESERLVSFVDLAPTMLSLAGIDPGRRFHGQAFAGPHAPRRGPGELFGLRGRMDERYDLVRSVTDGRYVYVRNYHPHRPHGQRVAYMFQTPATAAWKARHAEGVLDPAQRAFWEPKASEELYDLEADPYETANRVGDPRLGAVVERLRMALERQQRRWGDVGLVPEAEMLRRAAGSAPGDLRAGSGRRGMVRLVDVAARAANREAGEVPVLRRWARDADAAVRWWAALGFLVRGEVGVMGNVEVLTALMADVNPSVRVMAAEGLASHGQGSVREAAMECLLAMADARRVDYFDAVAALNAIDGMREQFRAHRAVLEGLPRSVPGVEPRVNEHLNRLLTSILEGS